MTTKTNAAKMTLVEKIGFEASVALEKDTALLRGWQTGNDPAVIEAVAAYNEREAARCRQAALASLKL